MSHATRTASSSPFVPRDNPRIVAAITHNNKYGVIFFSKVDIANSYYVFHTELIPEDLSIQPVSVDKRKAVQVLTSDLRLSSNHGVRHHISRVPKKHVRESI